MIIIYHFFPKILFIILFDFFSFPIFSFTFTLLPFLKPHSDNRRFKQPQQQQQQPASGVPGDHARVSGGDTRVSGSSQMASNNNGGVQIHQPQHRPQQHTNGVLLKASQKDLQSKYHLLSKTNKIVMGRELGLILGTGWTLGPGTINFTKKSFLPKSFFGNFKNGQKSIFELGKSLKLP